MWRCGRLAKRSLRFSQNSQWGRDGFYRHQICGFPATISAVAGNARWDEHIMAEIDRHWPGEGEKVGRRSLQFEQSILVAVCILGSTGTWKQTGDLSDTSTNR